ncbi:hypothetical protein ACN5O8_06875 [Aliarcobacter butzleri]|uniref:hypothetical protein n=1 Tax=Aliarcobacter butzleri TaxID=28197 RepID=UPI003AF9A03B
MENNMEKKIDTIIANTEEIKQKMLKKDEKIIKIEAEKEELQKEEEMRKEKLREAQKSFKKIGCNVKEEVADRFEELAHRLNYPNTSAMCRTYMMLLLENEEYQKTFVEFATVLKSESGEA